MWQYYYRIFFDSRSRLDDVTLDTSPNNNNLLHTTWSIYGRVRCCAQYPIHDTKQTIDTKKEIRLTVWNTHHILPTSEPTSNHPTIQPSNHPTIQPYNHTYIHTYIHTSNHTYTTNNCNTNRKSCVFVRRWWTKGKTRHNAQPHCMHHHQYSYHDKVIPMGLIDDCTIYIILLWVLSTTDTEIFYRKSHYLWYRSASDCGETNCGRWIQLYLFGVWCK